LDVSALRRDYRNNITQLPNSAIHRKNVDDGTLAESCYIYLQGWEIEEEMTMFRCEYISWAYETYLAKSVFETSGCSIYKKSIFLIDNKIILTRVTTDRNVEKVR
jgi:hypothetical protein